MVRRRVSGAASTRKVSPSRSTTVRQAPDTAIDSPGANSPAPRAVRIQRVGHRPGEDTLHGAQVLHQASEHGRPSLIRPSEQTCHDTDRPRDPPRRHPRRPGHRPLRAGHPPRGEERSHRGRHAGAVPPPAARPVERRAPGRAPVRGASGQAAARGGRGGGPGDQRVRDRAVPAPRPVRGAGIGATPRRSRRTPGASSSTRCATSAARAWTRTSPRGRGSRSWRTGRCGWARTSTGPSARTCGRWRCGPSSSTACRRTTGRRTRPGPDGKVRITTDYPDLLPFRTYAHDGRGAAAALRREHLAGLPREREGAAGHPRGPRASRRGSSAWRPGRTT